MNQRTVSILELLRPPGQSFTLADLAERFDVSQRTIRKDLEGINDFLEESGVSPLTLERGGRIVLPDSFGAFSPQLSQEGIFSYHLSPEERLNISAAILVHTSGTTTLASLAERLGISRATVIGDLNGVKEAIRAAGLEVISLPNKGLRVEGAESRKRALLLELAGNRKSPGRDRVQDLIGVPAQTQLLLQKIVNQQEHAYSSFLTDESFYRVTCYLGILVSRNEQGKYMEIQPETSSGKYRMAQDIMKYVAQYCHIQVTKDELKYFSTLLSAQRYTRQKQANVDMIKIQLLTRQFIEEVSQELGVDLNGDFDFFENLSNHLASVLSSASAPAPEREVFDEVQELHPEVFAVAKRKMPLIIPYAKRSLNSAELGYIAVHICAALERRRNKETTFRVIVACHAGIGTSKLLLERLKERFHFQIADIVSSHEAAHLQPGMADLVISTIPLQSCAIETVQVSALPTDEDYIRIRKKADTLRKQNRLPGKLHHQEPSAVELMNQITPILYEEAPEQAPALNRRLSRVVRSYFRQPETANTEVFLPELHHLLPLSHIELDVECTDWQDAVRKSARRLLERGYIEPQYIDAMIENILEFGPYIVISKGFAVPHARVEQGSLKVGMNLIRLKTPVSFGAGSLDPIEFVCCLCAVDGSTHLKAFFNLVNLLKNDSFRQRLWQCETEKQAAELILHSEYQLE